MHPAPSRFMKLVFCCLFLALSDSVLAAPEVTFVGASIILKDKGQRYELRDMIDSHSFHETLHAVCRRGSDYYIVYGSSEMSRGWPPRSGNCGAGIESFIRWLQVRKGQVIAQQEGLYVSCSSNRDGWQIAWKDHKLTWSAMGLKKVAGDTVRLESVELNWTFDPAHPELGITEKHKLEDAAQE
jgi:hypothetical protein